MRIVVQKFGGTSVANEEARFAAIEHIESALQQGYGVVTVVSAMGRKGEPYATDSLLSVIPGDGTSSRRDLDILMSCGEAISAVVFADQLRSRGNDTVVLSGAQAGILTTEDHGNARIVEIRPARILEELQDGRIVVVMGFQGATVDGEVTTLGRGGSDTTATALGVALNAEVVDIFTDVNGIMTADPRIVSDARMLHQVTYAEICNLAYQGAKVIHPRAVEIAMQKNIPIRVRNTWSKDEGTLVTSAVAILESSFLSDRLVTGVTQSANITQIRLDGEDMAYRNVFAAMADHGISVDFISVSPESVAYTVADGHADEAVTVLRQMGFQPKTLANCAKVSVVGAGIAGVPGIMARIVDALVHEGIDILQFADSHTTMWCLVHQNNMERAVRALHRAFDLGV